MELPKGRTNNPSGRKPGSQNKETRELRQRITNFLEGHWIEVEKASKRLTPKDKVTFYRELLQYRLPKLESIQVHELGLENLSDEQIDQLIERLKNESTENQQD